VGGIVDTHRLFPDPSRTSEQRLRSRPGGGRPAWMDEILIRVFVQVPMQ
jgi:hypothetical protein